MGGLHHVELWVPDLVRAKQSWGWLLPELGWEPFLDWGEGCSWKLDTTYVVVEQSPALTGTTHDRCAPGLNHLAFSVDTPSDVDKIVDAAANHGWELLFAHRHPHAGGKQQYAAYLSDQDGYEAEIVAANFSPE